MHADSEEAYGDIEMDQLMGRDLSSVKCAKDITVLPALEWHWCFCVPHMDGAAPFCSATSLADGTGSPCLREPWLGRVDRLGKADLKNQFRSF